MNTLPDAKEIIRRLRGPLRIAKHLGITHSAVCQWERIPMEHVPSLVALSEGEISPEEMRPDVPWAAMCSALTKKEPTDDFKV